MFLDIIVIHVAFGQMYFELLRFISHVDTRKFHGIAFGFKCRDASFDIGGDILDGTFVLIVMITMIHIMILKIFFKKLNMLLAYKISCDFSYIFFRECFFN